MAQFSAVTFGCGQRAGLGGESTLGHERFIQSAYVDERWTKLRDDYEARHTLNWFNFIRQNLRQRLYRRARGLYTVSELCGSPMPRTRKQLLFWGLYTDFQDFWNFKDFKDFRLVFGDFKDLKYSIGFRPDFKEFRPGVRDFSELKSGFMDFGPYFRDFWPYSRDFTKDFRNFTADLKIFQAGFQIFSVRFQGLQGF